ncbi:hypothetical protein PIB30_107050, partial [Stylosanthes scabra]|nr:hypothetical protein [Stylosanthes scabra]
MQEVSSGDGQENVKEADFASKGKSKIVPKLLATQNNLKEGLVANKGTVKPVPKLTVTQSKVKEGELANKVMSKKGEIATDNQQQLVAPQSNCKEAQHSPKKLKKPVPKRLDFSHLQSTFSAITRRVNTLPPTLADQQGIPAEQPGSSHSKDLGQGNTGVNKNSSPAIERDATEGLLQKLDAARKRNYIVQSTSVTQQQKSSNSAQSIGNHGRENNVQVTQEMIQERQEEFPLPSSESEPQAEGNMEDQGGSEMGKGRPIVRATTID